MPETQRRTVPRVESDEVETDLRFLTFQRQAVLIKCEGLDERQLRFSPVGTGTNLLGLIAHLEVSERYWFEYHLAGQVGDDEWDFGMAVPDTTSPDEVFAAYRAAWAVSDRLVRAHADPGRPMSVALDGERLPMRWVLQHMTTETARHAGHADILRELADGVTGR